MRSVRCFAPVAVGILMWAMTANGALFGLDYQSVQDAQLALKARGFDPGSIDGKLGSQTRQAIRNFQQANNLEVTGRLDFRTQEALGVNVLVPPAAGNVRDESERARNAALVLSEIMQAPDARIPTELLDRAHAIAIIPRVVKGAFGFGGRYGRGLITKRRASGEWGTPAYMTIGGGSFGLQIGVTATDLVLVFTDHGGVEGLLKGRLKLGADASAAAGPVGRTAEAGTDLTLSAAIYSYSRSKGLFAGVSLDGAVVSMDDNANRRVYGRGATGREILLHESVPLSTVTVELVRELQNWAPRRIR